MSFWKDKKVLVTGGAGMVGSYLTEWLVRDGAQVTVADNLSSGKLEYLKAVLDDISFHPIDLADLANCERVCQGQEVVFNLAAKVTGIGFNITHHAEMFESNMLLQQNVIHAAAGQRVKRFVQVSTACVYPHDAAVPTPESEGTRGEPEPTNRGYGWAKRMGERLAEYYTRETEMEAVIVRPFNAYSPRDHFDPEMCHVIPALIHKIFEGNNPIEIWGSGNQSRVFVHAKDVARGMQLLAEHASPADPVNIGHEQMITIRELFELISDTIGLNVRAFFDSSKPEGYPKRAADTTKFRTLTGYSPVIPLRKGIAETIAAYQTQRRPRRPLQPLFPRL